VNQKIYLKYLREYTLIALENSGDEVSQAADYLERQSRPGIFSKDRLEKRAALDRAKKIFSSSRERSLYVVLKSLGFDDLAKEKI
jgi:hypothetical protein